MNKPSLLLGAACMAAAIPVLAQQAPDAMPSVEVRHQLQVSEVCPKVFEQLPDLLSRTAYELNVPTEVLVNFTIAGDRITDLHTKSDAWGIDQSIRRAVRKLHCQAPDQTAYSVKFRILFQYSDEPDGRMVQLPLDFAPAMVRR